MLSTTSRSSSIFRSVVCVRPINRAQQTSSQSGNLNRTPADNAAVLSNVSSDKKETTDNWHTIYKFPNIKAIVGLNRLKVHQAALTALAVPLSMSLETAAFLPTGSAQVIAALGITGTISLCLASWTAGRNVIGFAYVDRAETPTMLRIASPDFWGRRRNIQVPIESIVPQHAGSRVPLDMYLNVRFNNCNTGSSEEPKKVNSETFKLLHRHGEIVRQSEFTYVFGECY